jgi:hypothetical protein
MVGISFNCLKCGEHGELHRSKYPEKNNRFKYLALEDELKDSKIAHLHKTTTGYRNLCPSCLSQLVEWQKAS